MLLPRSRLLRLSIIAILLSPSAFGAASAAGCSSSGETSGELDASFSDTTPAPSDAASRQDTASDAPTEASEGAGDSGATTPVKANVVFFLADDFSMNLLAYMPHVQAMMKNGITFSHNYVTDSLCCPSRTSIFTGKYPHQSHVFTNGGDAGGFDTFMAWGNDRDTFAAALSKEGGYRTALMGKFLNGYDPDASLPSTQGVPVGWTTWSVAGNGYPEFNYALNQDGHLVNYGKTPDAYLTDVISGQGSQFIKASSAAGSPFLLELSTFAPHAPYTPAPRHAMLFPGLGVPRTPTFAARPGADAPAWLKSMPALTQAQIDHLDAGFRLRAQAVQAIDEMIGSIQDTLAATGHDKDTYILFSGDNGYHMGDYSLRAGKQTAFDTDIHVPLIVTGPGISGGTVVDAITENIDLCATFSELGVTAAPATASGRSLVPFLRGAAVSDWRNVALIEHHATNDPSDPDAEPGSGDPPTYEALRLTNAVYVEYATGETEYHDLATDPDELTNTVAALPAARVAALHKTVADVASCTDAASCWKAQHYVGP